MDIRNQETCSDVYTEYVSITFLLGKLLDKFIRNQGSLGKQSVLLLNPVLIH